MKIWQHISMAAACTLASLAASDARAIPLPDTSSCNSTTQCLKITNTSTNNITPAIRGEGNTGVHGQGTNFGLFGVSSTGLGIYASSGTGTGAYGTSNGGAGVVGNSFQNDGVQGTTSNSDHSGVAGFNQSSAGTGVYGNALSSGTGRAVEGDAGNSSTAWAGFFHGRVSATSYVTSSDARLKKDVQPLPYGLAVLNQLRPVLYRWKNEDQGSRKQLGLIAQEVQELIPELVETDASSGMLSVNYQALVPVVIKALKEQHAVNKKQEARIAALEKAQSPVLSSNATALALGLLPLGLIAAWRRRRPESAI